ncbi:MAG: hypothetical protein ONB37_18425 [candidate division KSB1 bacterium]|nr:hypothetical protein [candidate division KSB1 bacterium]
MHKVLVSILFVIMLLVQPSLAGDNCQSKLLQSDTLVMLQNDQVLVTFSLWGGALIDFHFHDQGTNPFTWRLSCEEMPLNNRGGAPFQGHFICLGRWGSPSLGEIRCGIPHNGEPANRWWKLTNRHGQHEVHLSVEAPLEQFILQRSIRLSPDQSWFGVTEKLINQQNSGRLIVLMQHATFGAPFLSESVVIDCNATHGFNQSLILIDPDNYHYRWPMGLADTLGTPMDLRRSDGQIGYVSTHIIEEDYGWATAANPKMNLLVGYVWKRSDYPWLHIWHGLKDGRLWAKGIEFGTTGLGDTFSPEDRLRHQFHGVTHFEFLDAQAAVEKKYLCFLLKIPADFQQVRSVSLSDNFLQVDYSAARQSYTAKLTVESF